MAESFNNRFGFFANTNTANTETQNIERVTRTLEKLDTSFSSSINNLNGLLKNTSNDLLKKTLPRVIALVKKQEEVQKKVKNSKEAITTKDADNFIKVSKELKTILKLNSELFNPNTLRDLKELAEVLVLAKDSKPTGSEDSVIESIINPTGAPQIEGPIIFEKDISEGSLTEDQKTFMSNQPIVDAIENQTMLLIEALNNQTISQNEEVDDVKDAIESSNSFFSRNSGLGGASRGILRAGVGGLGALLGFDALKDIQSEGLTTERSLQTVAGGAGIGFALGGPLGALIGAGVGGFSALIADSITDEHIAMIKSGFMSAAEKISGLLSNFLQDPIGSINAAFTSMELGLADAIDFTVAKASEISKGIGTWKDNLTLSLSDSFDSIESSIDSGLSSFSKKFKNTLSEAGGFFSSLFGDEEEVFDGSVIRGKFGAKEKEIANNAISAVSSGVSAFSKLPNLVQQGNEAVEGFLKENGIDPKALQDSQQATFNPSNDSMETSSGIQNEISQMNISKTIKESSTQQIAASKEQTKTTINAVQGQNKNNRLEGRRNLNNSPIHTTDTGLVMVLGGGL